MCIRDRSKVGKDGFLIIGVAAGDVVVMSPLFPVVSTAAYQVSGIIKHGTQLAGKTAAIKIEYFSVTSSSSGGAISPVGVTGVDGEWVASSQDHEITQTLSSDATATTSVASLLWANTHPNGFDHGTPDNGDAWFWVPPSANYARMVITVESVTAANHSFHLTDLFAIKISGILNNPTLNVTYNLLPDYLRSDDENTDISGLLGHSLVMRKLLAISYAYSIIVGEEIRTWSYTRPTDSDTNSESLSVLTDPQKTPEAYLNWLAQLLGVNLTNPFLSLIHI